MNLLLIAAEPREFDGLLIRAEGASPVPLAADWARRCSWRGHDALLVANGAGRLRAAAAVEAACQVFSPDAVVSTGFCGALDSTLRIATLVAAVRILGDGGEFRAMPLGGCTAGVVYTSDRVAQTAAEKANLRKSGATIVEMEAAGVAAEASKRGLPFSCVRAVTDLAHESFANDFNAALRSDGYFDTMRILSGSFRRPLARVPELFRLRNRCTLAAQTLGEFLADCRF
jgi:adenosylhomocysteine nucleosidase